MRKLVRFLTPLENSTPTVILVRMRRLPLLAFPFALGLVAACTQPGLHREPAGVSRTEALQAFQHVYQVAISDRCVNCHSTTDRPWQGDGAFRHPHTMNVQRGLVGLGVSCATCHGQSNWDQPHLPPGTNGTWTMPALEKGYTAAISPRDLCAMYKDPSRNFFEDAAYFSTGEKHGRTGKDLIDHVRDDAGGLVAWSFSPGPGRQVPIESHADFVADVTTWVEGDMPCPQN